MTKMKIVMSGNTNMLVTEGQKLRAYRLLGVNQEPNLLC